MTYWIICPKMQSVMKMPNYKEMYLKMARASEQAIRILIKAQQECEEMYLSGPELTVLSGKEEASEGEDTQARSAGRTGFQ